MNFCKAHPESKLEKKLLHYTGKAIADYQMIHSGDHVMACLSGGKDSFALVELLRLLMLRSNYKFKLFVFMLNPGLPGWEDSSVREWLEIKNLPYEILSEDIISIVESKLKPTENYCSLCSRLRRGIIYSYAKKNNLHKIALGHHRDDLITSFLMSILFQGETASMPPKLLTNKHDNILIRPMVYCQEKDIAAYAIAKKFPCLPKDLCKGKENKKRQEIKQWIFDLAKTNPKIPSNILHALQKISPSQLMDKKHWDFISLEAQRLQTNSMNSVPMKNTTVSENDVSVGIADTNQII